MSRTSIVRFCRWLRFSTPQHPSDKFMADRLQPNKFTLAAMTPSGSILPHRTISNWHNRVQTTLENPPAVTFGHATMLRLHKQCARDRSCRRKPSLTPWHSSKVTAASVCQCSGRITHGPHEDLSHNSAKLTQNLT